MSTRGVRVGVQSRRRVAEFCIDIKTDRSCSVVLLVSELCVASACVVVLAGFLEAVVNRGEEVFKE